jgi:hypothetical protein
VHSVFGKINYGGLKHNSLYLALVLPYGGWQSLIVLKPLDLKFATISNFFDKLFLKLKP